MRPDTWSRRRAVASIGRAGRNAGNEGGFRRCDGMRSKAPLSRGWSVESQQHLMLSLVAKAGMRWALEHAGRWQEPL